MNYKILLSLIYLFVTVQAYSNRTTYTPIVLWHGLGDSCCFPFSLGAISKKIQESLPGVYVLSLEIGTSIANDVDNGYFMHPNKQVKEACNIVNSDTNLRDGFNAIGFSQGSQFLRALVQRCSGTNVNNLISIGGQHQGIYGLPNCPSISHYSCDYIRRLLNHAAYFSWVQDSLVPATYWHDPLNELEYKTKNTFLADINNEMVINQTYIQRLNSLKNFVMVRFEKDGMVQPIISEWFGFYTPGQSQETQSLQDSDIYIHNRLGLQEMDAANKLHFLSVDGNHLQFNWTWFEKSIIEPYLKI